jgi:hypothetical protein
MSLDLLDEQAISHIGYPAWQIVNDVRQTDPAKALQDTHGISEIDHVAATELVCAVGDGLNRLNPVSFSDGPSMEKFDAQTGLFDGYVTDVTAALVASHCLHEKIPHWFAYAGGRWLLLLQQNENGSRPSSDAMLQDWYQPDGKPSLTVKLSEILSNGDSVPRLLDRLHRIGSATLAIDAKRLAIKTGSNSLEQFKQTHLRPRIYDGPLMDFHGQQAQDPESAKIIMRVIGPRGRRIARSHSSFITDVANGNSQRAAFDLMALSGQIPGSGMFPEIDGRAPNNHVRVLEESLVEEGAISVAYRSLKRYVCTERIPGINYFFVTASLAHKIRRTSDSLQIVDEMGELAHDFYTEVLDRTNPDDPEHRRLRDTCAQELAALTLPVERVRKPINRHVLI